jgi:hypothetical protein
LLTKLTIKEEVEKDDFYENQNLYFLTYASYLNSSKLAFWAKKIDHKTAFVVPTL